MSFGIPEKQQKFLTSSNSIAFRRSSGFTIVELLVVIVVIAILATITAVSYAGISQRANIASIQQQLSSNSSLLRLYNAENSSYPTSLDTNYCPSAPIADTKNCLKSLAGATMTYTGTASTFKLVIAKGDLKYKVTESGAIAEGTLTCPTGFIVVPGSPTYGTSDFCVMKYEAKIQGNDNGEQVYNSAFVPESRATGTPWVYINQINAIAEAQTACDGCHLITEAEWMTIAQNVLSVGSNWSSGLVGTGYVYRGNSDDYPWYGQAASSDDDGYYGTSGNSPSSGPGQKRTLTLASGQVIWDFSGNALEWTAGQITGNQPGITGETGFVWKEYTAVTTAGTITPNIMPAGVNLSGASLWDSSNGIGQLYSYAGDATLRGFLRGGFCEYYNARAGVLSLNLGSSPSNSNRTISFRVTSPGI